MAHPRYQALIYLLAGLTGGLLLGFVARTVFLTFLSLDPILADLVLLVVAVGGAYKGLAAALRVLRRT